MREFNSWLDCNHFSNAVKKRYRYIQEKKCKEFLKTVFDTAKKRIESIQADELVWRAQIGHRSRPVIQEKIHIGEEEVPFEPERMKPLENSAIEGRANSKGIPCLYVSTSQETALAEVRPWVGTPISVGQFKILRQLNVVNCTVHTGKHYIYLDKEPSPEEREVSVWHDIDNAFARPITPTDNLAAYAPTQIIAEWFKIQGLDGIKFRSSIGPGYNIAFFDLNVADLIKCQLYSVKDVNFDFDQYSSPYYVKTHSSPNGD